MALKTRHVSIPVTGLDEGVADIIVGESVLTRAENVAVKKNGALSLRPGALERSGAQSAAISHDPVGIIEHRGELIALAREGSAIYSDEASSWRLAGTSEYYPSTARRYAGARVDSSMLRLDSTVQSGYVISAWDTTTGVWWCVRDESTLAWLVEPQLLAASGTGVQVLATDTTRVVILYITGTGSAARVSGQMWQGATPSAIGSVVTISTSRSERFVAAGGATDPFFAISYGDGGTAIWPVISYRVNSITLAREGSATHPASTGSKQGLAMCYDALNSQFLTMAADGTVPALKAWVTPEAYTGTAPTTSVLSTAVATADLQMTCSVNFTKFMAVWERTDGISWDTLTSAGVPEAAGDSQYNVEILTTLEQATNHPPMMWVWPEFSDGTPQKTGGGGISAPAYDVSGKWLYPVALLVTPYLDSGGTGRLRVVARAMADRVGGQLRRGNSTAITTLTANVAEGTLRASLPTLASNVIDTSGATVLGYAEDHVLVDLDPLPPTRIQAADSVIISGGQPGMHDGQLATEVGAITGPPAPWRNETTAAFTAGANGQDYAIVYRWRDASGRAQRSPASPRTTYASGTPIDFVIAWSPFGALIGDDDRAYQIEVYATVTADGSGGPLYLKGVITEADAVSGKPGEWALAIAGATGTSGSEEPLYTTGGVLDREPPPPFQAAALHESRVWVASGDDSAQVWPSQIITSGVGVSWHSSLAVEIPESGSEVRALWSLGGRLVVATDRSLWWIAGEGPDNSGSGSAFSRARLIMDAIGARGQGGVVVGPFGVLWQGDDLQLYVMDAGMQHTLISRPVIDSLTGEVRRAFLVEERDEVRILVDGSTVELVWNYRDDIWTTWTGVSDIDAINRAGAIERQQAYSTGVWYDDDATTTDVNGALIDPIVIETGWIRPGGVEGFGRMRRVEIHGVYHSGVIKVSLDYDHEGTYPTVNSFQAADLGSDGDSIDATVHVDRQKAGAFRVKVETGQTVPEGTRIGIFDLSAIGLELGVKSGYRRGRLLAAKK